ncbi:NAD-dependent epimerase [Prochlorococcus marinus XMU1412]|uniref:NAD-dependent epimerase n=1 Tax=Prochlorococcus marinus TaxID=1219 RepID=UPI001ADB9B35|nr:NAD-dependent epimerase [Prochlorococcus marinus]MBO8240520.1 NAD-dependent epimerase [Prochlorococcus marinus XMU1412]MBW3071754.1 capsular biosynthesis protein CpsI [Prochlorococcus marinus str. MU1412]
MTIIVTGAAGFIGFHLCRTLLNNGDTVIGIDCVNNYYDVSLKKARLEILSSFQDLFVFKKVYLEDKQSIENIFQEFKPKKVVNLAAQAGVRYSLENPDAYINSNLVGFLNILESCRKHKVEHLVYASSSSVYGGNINMPFSEMQNVDHPVSLYAATKKANELIAHSYSHLYGIPSTGLRFFTVYGPWGRPDMALFLFTKAIFESKPIKVFNEGNMIRDFTYIDDIIESVIRVINKPPGDNLNFNKSNPNAASSWAPHKIFNIGNSNPVKLMNFIKAIEDAIGIKAIKNFEPIQPGDVPATHADTKLLENWIDFKPKTSINEGIRNFVEWYKSFYNI